MAFWRECNSIRTIALLEISIKFYVMETFLAIRLDKSVFLSGNSHLLGSDYRIRKNKMAARFSVVSGRGNRRGKCENLEKI